jgi:hypothetical protein
VQAEAVGVLNAARAAGHQHALVRELVRRCGERVGLGHAQASALLWMMINWFFRNRSVQFRRTAVHPGDRTRMLGVTLFGLIFTPIFYIVVRSDTTEKHYIMAQLTWSLSDCKKSAISFTSLETGNGKSAARLIASSSSREGSIELAARDGRNRGLLEIVFHHQALSAKPLFDIFRGIVAAILQDSIQEQKDKENGISETEPPRKK